MPSFFPSQQGPSLPKFRSILATGPYHASAPVHLALSYALENPESRPIILSPSRISLQQELVKLNDSWIATNSRRGDMIQLASRISILYPPSPVHLCLFLSMLRPSAANDSSKSGPWLNSKTTRAPPPDLIILLEPSTYLLPSSSLDSVSYTVSSYLSLITRVFSAMATITIQSNISPSFVLFDSNLYKLKLPVVRPPPSHAYREDDQHDTRLEPVLTFVEKYFEWMAFFEEDEDIDLIPSSQGEDAMEGVPATSRRVKLFRIREEDSAVWLSWKEFLRPSQSVSELQERHFDMGGG